MLRIRFYVFGCSLARALASNIHLVNYGSAYTHDRGSTILARWRVDTSSRLDRTVPWRNMVKVSALLDLPRLFAVLHLSLCVTHALAQDPARKGIALDGLYDGTQDKIAFAIVPSRGVVGDSLDRILARDLVNGDRFAEVTLDSELTSRLALGEDRELSYRLLSQRHVRVLIQANISAKAMHILLNDVDQARVVDAEDFQISGVSLSRSWRLSVHRAADGIERRLTGTEGISATRVAYVRVNSIRVTDSDGANEISVPTEGIAISPAWNSTGTMLVYATVGTDSHIAIVDLSTGRNRTVVGPRRNTVYATPVFTPDGKSIVYAQAGEHGSDLFQVASDGTREPQRKTNGAGTDNWSPSLSPNGDRMVFMSGRTGHPELYMANTDGTGTETLTDYEENQINFRADPDWSPDGRTVAYSERYNGHFQIRIVRSSGKEPKFLTDDGENEQPSWAPDSRHLVFTSTRIGVRQLWVLDIESGQLRQLTHAAGARLAAWSPRLTASD